MEETTKKIVIASVIVLIVAIVALNFEQITGKAVARTKITVTPRIVTAGHYVNVEIMPPKGGASRQVEIYKENGVRQATFNTDCGGNWCYEEGRLGKVATGSYKTSPDWEGRYYVAVEDRDTGELVKAYFKVE